MADRGIETVLERIGSAPTPDRADLVRILRIADPVEMASLTGFADAVRRRSIGDGVLLRGIVEFSNFCRNTCQYCGLNRRNTRLARYRLTREQVVTAARNICATGIKTVVLQSGEEDNLDAVWLREVIVDLRSSLDAAITLCVGERSRQEYQMWKQAGADRYLLKIETSDPALYESLHPGMSFCSRTKCLEDLADLGYQVGSGNLVGLKGQTVESLAGDLAFFQRGRFDMISVSPFIPHSQTPLAAERAGDLEMTVKMIALTRILCPNAHIPASTAIGSLHGRDERPRALAAGANVIMPNFTPGDVRRLYDIYPGKAGCDLTPQRSVAAVEKMVTAMGRRVDYARGDALRLTKVAPGESSPREASCDAGLAKALYN
ncbi:MAG TPA: [FeFe] hydrogenase H-cluster radical SAM maturase HydE [Sedimentisphaerales bacterium]|nr:[FeFe] hydrogenase H-cluster radical SAM maturase HydE [Sedimentisphaerales bacterium]